MNMVGQARAFWVLIISLSLFLSASVHAKNLDDPLEPLNRVTFQFNETLDRFILKPVASVYNAVLPKPIAKCISNFFDNIYVPATVVNDLLQGNIYQFASDSWRFGINTTIGVLGFFDVASHIGLEPNSEDVGLTFAHWGYKKSAYLVLPFFGPSTIRDGVGMLGYYYLTPYPYIKDVRTRYSIYAVDITSRRANLLHYQAVLDQAAVDKYTFMRDAYLQRRAYQMERNRELGNPYLRKTEEDDTAAEEKTIPSPIDEI
jgi:phospholipid-binding lipoprotein MlaA